MKLKNKISLTILASFLMFPCFAKTKLSNGINYYEYIPNPGKPTLILSHPFGVDVSFWKEIIPLISDDFGLLIYDLRGHGHSKSDGGLYTVELLGQDVINLLDTLNIKEAYYCGVSISGYIGQYLAINHQERIKKVILSNINPSNQTPEQQKGLIEVRTNLKKDGAKVITKWLLEIYFTEEFKKARPDLFLSIKRVIDNGSKVGFLGAINVPLTANFTDDQLAKINIPTLLIQGKHDVLWNSEELGISMSKKIQNSKLNILDGGHVVALEKPEEYSKVIKDFLLK